MMPRWVNLNEKDRLAVVAVTAFLQGRLEERATVDWALRLNVNDTIQRVALLDIIDSPDGGKINEPWFTAWKLIEESWNNPVVGHFSTNEVFVRQRLLAGEKSGSLVAALAQLVAPRLEVKAFLSWQLHFQKPIKRPKKFSDICSARLTSGEVIDPGRLKLDSLTDAAFLHSLALALDAAVISGLDIARRIGWDGKRQLCRLGMLHRVYYVPNAERAHGEHEPDKFHKGIAPSVKLLHAVIARIVELELSAAIAFVRRWKLIDSPIHQRLWAALSRDARITSADEVGDWLLSLDDRRFWEIDLFPEIAELRAIRFGEFEQKTQTALLARIRKRPPRKHWSGETDTTYLERYRNHAAVRELRRIEITGIPLTKRDKAWLDERLHEFPDLAQMDRIDAGFMNSPKAYWVQPNPDSQYDLHSGEERLRALQATLSSAHGGWDDNPAERASDWIRQPGNSIKLIADFECISDGGTVYDKVWERFGWTHSPAEVKQGEDAAQRDLPAESSRVLALLAKLSEAAVRAAIDGISNWLSAWAKQIVVLPEGINVWFKIWPIAVESTNAKPPVEEKDLLNTVAWSSVESEPEYLDTLNTPAGKLVEVFLMACPTVKSGDQPFSEENYQRLMRDEIDRALGPTGSIVKYRLIEWMPYFLFADKQWTLDTLVPPLRAENHEARVFWPAVVRQRPSFEVMSILGDLMADRTVDPLLGRETRRDLVFRVVIDCLYAFKDKRKSAVSHPRITQMLRLLDDEVRAYGAEAMVRFIQDNSVTHDGEEAPPSPELLFQTAAKPFLQEVWPQERSLTTPEVSHMLAELPAATHEAFVKAVNTIERFLVPFNCWAMFDYGLYDKEDSEQPKLSIINTSEKAAALLRLLDLTIGTAEGSVIPYDLANALDHIRTTAPHLAENPVFRRLETASRRG
jgi:hypothetical protein